MKKILLIVMLLIIPITISGCSEETSVEENVRESNAFISFENGNGIYTIVHKETKVMYIVVKTVHGVAINLMVDTEGKPLLYEGEIK